MNTHKDTDNTPRLPGMVALDESTLVKYSHIVTIMDSRGTTVVVMQGGARFMIDESLDNVVRRLAVQVSDF